MVRFRPHISRKLLVCTLILALWAALAHAEDWPKYRRDLSNTGHSAEGGISIININLLKEKWQFDERPFEAGVEDVARLGSNAG